MKEPALQGNPEVHKASLFMRLYEIVAILRSPEGCPWDREQTHQSIRKNLLEEVYEVLETIDEDDSDHMREELGDLLLQIMLHARMEEERGTFSVFDVIEDLNEKLIRRHPHVFGEKTAADASEALSNWEQIKKEEKMKKGTSDGSVLSGIPKPLPALMRAYKLQKKAGKAGFEFPNLEEVQGKIEEEWRELKEAVGSGEARAIKEELGDVLFSLVNLARFLQIDPEEALAATNRKFEERFRGMETILRQRGMSMEEAGIQYLDQLWDEMKKKKTSG